MPFLQLAHLKLTHFQLAVGSAGQRQKCFVLLQTVKYVIYSGFHHFFAAHGLIALIFKKVAAQQLQRFFAIAALGVDCRQVIAGAHQTFIFTGYFQGLFLLPVSSQENRGKDPVKRIMGIDLECFLRIIICFLLSPSLFQYTARLRYARASE